MGHSILVTGGAKSGKSAFAEQLAQERGKRLGYIATSQAGDEEMRERIRRHQERRDARWATLEESHSPSKLIAAQTLTAQYDVLLLDCMTVLISNIILRTPLDWDTASQTDLLTLEEKVKTEVKALAAAAREFSGLCILVANEVGFGIVPPSPLARFFRDCAGSSSQYLAAQAEEVYLVVAGLPLCLKK